MTVSGAMSKSSSPDVTLRQLLRGSAPAQSSFSWDSDVPKSSPLSAQDLKSGISQDMPVSSTAFQWPSGESHSIARGCENSSEIIPGSLADWTHFDPGLGHPSENDPHNILRELLKDDPSASDNVLKHLLNEKAIGEEGNNKQLRILLGESLGTSNGSPNIVHQEQLLINSFMHTQVDMNQNPPSTGKRKIEEIDGAEPGNAPKLAEKNKMLAALLQSTTKQSNDGGLPVPNPGDLPQNKLPKDLSNRILAPPGQGHIRSGQFRNPALSGSGIDAFPEGEDASNTHDNMDDVLDMLKDLVHDQQSGSSDTGNDLTQIDRQAIADIKRQLFEDFALNGPSHMQPEPMSYRGPSLAPSIQMGPRYAMAPNQMIRAPMNVFHNGADVGGMMMQRMPGNAMMLSNQVNPPSRPGIPSDFNASRSPVPPSGTPNSTDLKAQLRMQAWNRVRAQQIGQANMARAPSLQVSNNPASLQRSLSIPSPSNPNFPMNGFQNVPQNHPQFSQQQSVPYSPPPQGALRFSVQTPAQPLSPRHPNPQVSSRMMRPGLWSQQSQISGMGTVGAPQSPHPLQPNNSMNMAVAQPNPPPYSNQQFINQNNGQQFNIPAHMMTQNPNQQQSMQARMTPGGASGGGLQASQFTQQGAMQQDGFGNNSTIYQRNLTSGMQPRMVSPGQNQALMRSNFNALSEDMRNNDGSFGAYQMNGAINSAPPNLGSQQQFRWDLGGGDRSNMSMPGTPNMSSQNAARMTAPTMPMDSYQSFDFFNDVDTTPNGLSTHSSQGHHVTEQQFRQMYPADSQSIMSQHLNQSYASSADMMGVNRPGSSPVHQHLPQPGGDRQKSLLQQLLSENNA